MKYIIVIVSFFQILTVNAQGDDLSLNAYDYHTFDRIQIKSGKLFQLHYDYSHQQYHIKYLKNYYE